MAKFVDLTGMRFGNLLVLCRGENDPGKHVAHWHCVCDCGKNKRVNGSSLRRGLSKSCGCGSVRWGNTDAKTHGLHRHRLAGTWRSMKERCFNPNHLAFHRYGGRGITVCDRWLSFENFVSDNDDKATPGTTLDRIDNDGPYSPENTRWSASADQARNRCTNVFWTYLGERMCVADWAARLETTSTTLLCRMNAGWSLEKTLSTPIRRKRQLSAAGSR